MKKVIKAEPQNTNEFEQFREIYHPPMLPMPDIPVANHYGAYMVKRKFDVHTGVDLYAIGGTAIYSIEDGEVVNIRKFTGDEAGTAFWENTLAIDIEGYTGTICYGEIEPESNLRVGDMVKKGQRIGFVKRVIKKFNGKATSMLHFAIHRHGLRHLLKDQADSNMESFYDLQLDPTMLLIQLKHKADLMMLNGGKK